MLRPSSIRSPPGPNGTCVEWHLDLPTNRHPWQCHRHANANRLPSCWPRRHWCRLQRHGSFNIKDIEAKNHYCEICYFELVMNFAKSSSGSIFNFVARQCLNMTKHVDPRTAPMAITKRVCIHWSNCLALQLCGNAWGRPCFFKALASCWKPLFFFHTGFPD